MCGVVCCVALSLVWSVVYMCLLCGVVLCGICGVHSVVMHVTRCCVVSGLVLGMPIMWYGVRVCMCVCDEVWCGVASSVVCRGVWCGVAPFSVVLQFNLVKRCTFVTYT